MSARVWLGPRAWLPFIASSTLACGSLIGLGDLQKADCSEGCMAGAGADSGGSGTVANGGASSLSGTTGNVAGSAPSGGSSGGGPGTGGTDIGVAGTANTGGTATGGSGGGGGDGGDEPISAICPGGEEPPATWTEHWFEHEQVLTRVYYDDCVALYFDAGVPAATTEWLAPFLGKAWAYSLATYGDLGPERVYAVVHQGNYSGGHTALHIDASHDNRTVIDMAQGSWPSGSYDLPAHLFGFLVDALGAHTKYDAPKADHYGNEGFPLIYKYDLFEGLGMTTQAEAALTSYSTRFNNQPYANTYWFRDWFLPIWRDHGHAQVFASYQTLLQKYYPAGTNQRMPTMNYGQYFHFMSGAAGTDLAPLAREAFEWHADFDAEIASAKTDFPDIEY